MRPYLGGAPVEELRHLAQANVSMDIDTFTNLNPLVLQSLSVDNVTTLLGQNVGDLQKVRSHPTISSWLRSLNHSALGELGLDTDVASTIDPALMTGGTPNTKPWPPLLAHPSGLPGDSAEAPTSVFCGCSIGQPRAHLGLLAGGPYCGRHCPRVARPVGSARRVDRAHPQSWARRSGGPAVLAPTHPWPLRPRAGLKHHGCLDPSHPSRRKNWVGDFNVTSFADEYK
nr:mesothelin-like protein isoform X1 [Loxodonta africana]